jgi:hypothetical protein
MEFLGFVRKGAGHVIYEVTTDGKVQYGGGSQWDVEKLKTDLTKFCLKGYCLVVRGIIDTAIRGEIHLVNDKRDCSRNTTADAFSGIIDEYKTKGSEVTLILRKGHSGIYWDYISDKELEELKLTPLENLIKDRKKIQFLRAAGWGDDKINNKLNQKK